MSHNVITIKPKVLIKILEDKFTGENITGSFLMPPSYIGSLTLLESAMLLAFVKLIQPKHVFEFGTFMGHTSVFFAKNIAEDALVHTIDLPQGYIVDNGCETKAEEVDNLLREQSITSQAKCIENEGQDIQRKINRILCNSLEFCTKAHTTSAGIIFIDGGHDTEIVKSDTCKALEMLSEGGVIVWHDYNSTVFTDVTDYVNEFAKCNTIFHIANTNIAFMWKAEENLVRHLHNSLS
ncbi:class I SAM-dependent methyltransferase [Pseudoalteromonas arctica]|uniref:Class I SAM-dependent methyltransferase n=1 Tax=Pseudoalteromonas arctica TaxID=394751 RepID=A0AAP6Y598_9GAMM|nr:class I SAM-dependent methyltransferase [Pseudoalteromonas arctica]NMP03415.1 class I SAM-dependent methyltransferase [Pseudoalteromonas arctica]